MMKLNLGKLNHMKYVILIFVVFQLFACAKQPLATETVEPIIVATKTQFSPTQTATTTPIVIPDFDELPSWMRIPESTVLAALITDDLKGIRNVAFFNAATGEKYEMSMPKDVRGFF
jgi:hypothetical protein